MSVFTIQSTECDARAGMLRTSHGDVPTPAFIPVATQGSVKALDPADLHSIGANIILSNTYHLYLRPGVEVVESMGGLHKFMAWDGPILTDSGGYQGFSLEHLRKITEEGILFKSHIDGSMHRFGPEEAIRYQERLGSDIIMPLDVCVSAHADKVEVEQGVARTSRWAVRSLEARSRSDQLLFAIVQGGLQADLRKRSVEELVSLDFPGYAIGGLSVGESKEEMYSTTQLTTRLLPTGSPRYLMGVGSPEDLVEGVARGIDMFDCALPTRIARNGTLIVKEGRINIETAPFKTKDRPIEESCDCYTCHTFSAAYVHHLFKSKELLAYRLATIHNLRFLLRLMDEMRCAIVQGRFQNYREEFHDRFIPSDQVMRNMQRQKWLAVRLRRNQSENAS